MKLIIEPDSIEQAKEIVKVLGIKNIEVTQKTKNIDVKAGKNDMPVKEGDIGRLLKNMGIGPNILGYGYLIEGIKLVMDDKSVINYITKELYPAIAAKKKTTPGRVERAISTAIKKGCANGNLKIYNDIFGYSADNRKDKPTNSLFISAVVEYIEDGGLARI